MAETAGARLRALLARSELIVAPGVYDGISALLAERTGFPALYMTGYGVVASQLGLADAGLGTYGDFRNRLAMIVGCTTAPVIADADTGFGGLVNLRHTVRGYEAAGAAAIQIEDQVFPKRCGHTEGKRVIPAEEMVRKIAVAAESRREPDFCIVARTDARAELGLEEAIRRARLYVEAGADLIFVEAPQSPEEMRQIAQEVEAPLVANMTTKGSTTPEVPAAKLREMGYALALHPGLAFLSAAAGMEAALVHLKQHGDTKSFVAPQFDLRQMHQLVGFPELQAFERRWSDE